jgi:DNA-binding transcriptional ArsR family regulator
MVGIRPNVFSTSKMPGSWRTSMRDSLRRFKAGVFQALGHPTRIAIVELLRDEGEIPVTRIHEQLGLEQAHVSQHLAVLRAKQIVVGRKEGNQVFYSLRDRVFGRILDLMRQFFEAHEHEALAMLKDMPAEE